MSPDTELGATLERALDDLPSVPATAYLLEGRRVRRRRRVVAALVVLPVLALGVGFGVDRLGPGGSDSSSVAKGSQATPKMVNPADLGSDPDYIAPEPNNPVEAVDGLEGVDWFTSTDIPDWAREHGQHGPVGVTADGRLWVAPDAVVHRVVVNPFQPGDGDEDYSITSSYAVEAEWASKPDTIKTDTVWVILSTDGSGPGGGTMDEPGRWTDDFELWVDDATSHEQGRPSFAERLARFADAESDLLVPGAEGVEIVQQMQDPEVAPGWEPGTREAAAEVRWAGKTWYVQASDPRGGGAWYIPYPGTAYPDFASFLEWLGSGS